MITVKFTEPQATLALEAIATVFAGVHEEDLKVAGAKIYKALNGSESMDSAKVGFGKIASAKLGIANGHIKAKEELRAAVLALEEAEEIADVERERNRKLSRIISAYELADKQREELVDYAKEVNKY